MGECVCVMVRRVCVCVMVSTVCVCEATVAIHEATAHLSWLSALIP